MSASNKIVIPAKAGTHLSAFRAAEGWVPAFAGMARNKAWIIEGSVDGRGHFVIGETAATLDGSIKALAQGYEFCLPLVCDPCLFTGPFVV